MFKGLAQNEKKKWKLTGLDSIFWERNYGKDLRQLNKGYKNKLITLITLSFWIIAKTIW